MPEEQRGLIEQDDNTQPEGMDVEVGEETGQEDQKVELSELAKNWLKQQIKKFAKEEDPNRRQEIIRARDSRMFWHHYQYSMYNANYGSWAVPAAGGFPGAFSNSDAQDTPKFFYVVNIYTAYGKTFVSSVAGTTPGVKFLPVDPFDPKDLDAAKEADKQKKNFFFVSDIGTILKDAARLCWTDGRVVGWVRRKTKTRNGEQFTDEVPDVFGVLEAKVPIALRSQCDFPYMQITYERHISDLKSEFKDVAKDIKAGQNSLSEDSFDRQARLMVMQGTQQMGAGDTYQHLCTYQATWMRPSVYELCNDKEQAIKEELEEKFPHGIRLEYAGDTFLQATPENIDDCLAVLLAMASDGQAGMAVGYPLLDIQRMLNNLSNLQQEQLETGTPMKFVDSKAIDTDALNDQTASPEMYFPVKGRPGEPIGNLFYKEQEPGENATLSGRLSSLMSTVAQLVCGIQPSMFGGPMTNSKTASVYAQARDQAMASMALTYGPMKRWLARLTEMAVLISEQREGDTINGMVPDSTGGFRNVQVSIEKLRLGKYRCYPEADDSIPESEAAQRSIFQNMIQTMGPNPQFQQLLMLPDNQYLFKRFSGLEGFVVPGSEARNVQLHEIEELLEGEPVMPTPEELQKVAVAASMQQAAGASAPLPTAEDMMRSSVPIDEEYDDHQAHYQEVQRWVNSDEGQKAKVLNPKGFMNVRLHGLEHKRVAQGQPITAQAGTPDPNQVIQAGVARTAMADHAQASAPQPPAPGQGGAVSPTLGV